MKDPKISIIVPVYNAEKYLHQCVDSILTQSFSDFELLLVDDGSSDNSGPICDEYVAMDSRIQVFHKENGGVSSARNLGLDNARGEFVFFSDADDEVLQNGLELLVEQMRGDAKFVMAGYTVLDENDNVTYEEDCRLEGQMMRDEAMIQMFKSTPYRYNGYLWNKLFIKTVIEEKHLRFDTDISFCEDCLFCVSYLSTLNKSDKVGFNWSPVYKYIERSTGAMSSLKNNFNSKFFSDLIAYKKMGKILRSNHFNKSICDVQVKTMCHSYRRILSMMNEYKVFSISLRIRAEYELMTGCGCAMYVDFMTNRIIRTIKRIICRNS